MSATAAAADRLPARLGRWAAQGRLSPVALTGIGFAGGCCAAVWFTAGTPAGMLAGGTALTAGSLALTAAARAAAGERPSAAPAPAGSVAAGSVAAGSAPAGSVAAGSAPAGSAPAGSVAAGPAPAGSVAAGPAPAGSVAAGRGAADGWLAAGCATAAELAAYGALAAGAPAGQQRTLWPLAAGALILLAFRQMAVLCRGPRPVRGPSRPAARAAWLLLTLPAPARAALITVTALAWGPRMTFLALLGWGTVATVAVLARRRWPPGGGDPADPVPGTGAEPAGLPNPPGRQLAGGAPASGTAPVPPIPAYAGLPACRGDGPIARRAGILVRGQLAPLPAALAGVAATGLLAAVGLHGLSGVVLLAPAAAMLLAAPGAAHPHDGRLDWLVPPALQAGQYIYLSALGFAAGVPGPLTFALPGVIALGQLDTAYRARHPLVRPRYAGAGLGWDGRILAAGFAAILGVATFAYLVLTAYLGLLLGWICLSSWYSVQEGVRR